ncbi:FUSC family protein [Oleidesulfovibrio sp.]|uniref:FUSC family protein n=1 Tax=Oleidesulfovibrio sp. TaxID=2909707 RepID=UPI003A83DC3A
MAYHDPTSTTAHVRHGIKTGIAAVLAYLVTQYWGFKFGYWASISAVIVMQMNVADSLQMGWYRFSGTAVGAVIGVFAILAFPDTTPMHMLSLFTSVSFCAYMTRYNARYRMAAITVCIVVLASYGQPEPVQFGIYRVLEIVVGVCSAFLVSILLWPQRVGEVLRERMRSQFAEAARLYEVMLEAFIDSQKVLDPAMLDNFNAGVAEDKTLYHKVASHERLLYHDDVHVLSLKVDTLRKCASHLRAMLHALNNTEGEGYDVIMKHELRELAEATKDGLQAIGQGRKPSISHLESSLAVCENRLSTLRDEGATKRFYLQKLLQFFAFYHSLQFMAHDLLHYAKQMDPLVASNQKQADL